MKPIALLFNGVWSHYAFAKAAKYQPLVDLCYVHNLQAEDLAHRKALLIPFQSNHGAIAQRKALIYDFLQAGGKVFVAGDSSAHWLEAQWEDRPVNNWWWVKDPHHPPVTKTDDSHPVYKGLKPRHACWHTHGVYTQIPAHAKVIQENEKGEIITWETSAYGGQLLVTTLDPIVEHGIQQITHLDHYVDSLFEWLCGERPQGNFQVQKADYGIPYCNS